MQWNLSDLTAFFEEMPKECHSSLATLKHHVEDCGCLQEKETHSEKCNLIQGLSKGNFLAFYDWVASLYLFHNDGFLHLYCPFSFSSTLGLTILPDSHYILHVI